MLEEEAWAEQGLDPQSQGLSFKHLWKAFVVPSTREAGINNISMTSGAWQVWGNRQLRTSTVNIMLKPHQGQPTKPS